MHNKQAILDAIERLEGLAKSMRRATSTGAKVGSLQNAVEGAQGAVSELNRLAHEEGVRAEIELSAGRGRPAGGWMALAEGLDLMTGDGVGEFGARVSHRLRMAPVKLIIAEARDMGATVKGNASRHAALDALSKAIRIRAGGLMPKECAT